MKETFDNEVIKAVNCHINLGESVLDVYMLPDGEKRIGIENAGIALGYSERFFFQRTQRDPKALKALQDMGFSGEQVWVKNIRQREDKRDRSLSQTVTLQDFTKLVTYEAIAKGNSKAIILLAAQAEFCKKSFRDTTTMKETFDNEVTKAVNCHINLGESVLDAYMLPDGEKRIGIENTGIALGYSERFFFQRTQRESKALKALRDMGFSGEQIWVKIIRPGEDKIGPSLSKTVSLRDFTKLVTYEATAKGNSKAIVLLAAFAETGVERILEDAFAGRSVDFLLEKIVHYTKWTQQDLEEVLAYNREEVRALHGWGRAPSLDDR